MVGVVIFGCSGPATLAGGLAPQFGKTTRKLLAREFTTVTLRKKNSDFCPKSCPLPPSANAVYTQTSVPRTSMPKRRGRWLAGGGGVGRHAFGNRFRRVALAEPEGCRVEARHSRNTLGPNVSWCHSPGIGHAAQAAIPCAGLTAGMPLSVVARHSTVVSHDCRRDAGLHHGARRRLGGRAPSWQRLMRKGMFAGLTRMGPTVQTRGLRKRLC
jgi:hypothetical protein